MRQFFAFALLMSLPAAVSCGGGVSSVPVVPPVPPPTEAVVPEGYVDAAEAARLQLAELRRVRVEHADLFTAIPTETPLPEDDSTSSVQEVAVARVLEWPEGYPVPAAADEFWFDPEQGLTFLRLDGGDWTSRSIRRSHPYRELFFFEDYPEGVPNLADGSLQREIALDMAFRAFELYPFLGEPTADVVDLFAQQMGWEVREAAGAVINVWTIYDLYDAGDIQRFGVGGVLALRERRHQRPDGDSMPYLAMGVWLGPVVVERLR